jgi:predicted transcriptional regulator
VLGNGLIQSSEFQPSGFQRKFLLIQKKIEVRVKINIVKEMVAVIAAIGLRVVIQIMKKPKSLNSQIKQ